MGHPVKIQSEYDDFLRTIKLWTRYSQFGEDSILDAIFNVIGRENKWCLEVGAADGLWFSNTRYLIEQGWDAIEIEANDEEYQKLVLRYQGNEKVRCWNYKIGVKPGKEPILDEILEASKAPIDIDLVVIDVDGQDYYILNSLLEYQPRVIMVEYDYDIDPMFIPECGGTGQAGRYATQYVAKARGYEVICATQTNLICVRKDLARLLLNEGLADESGSDSEHSGISAVVAMSTPRLGFLSNSDCIISAVSQFSPHLQIFRGEGVWWHQSLTRAIERGLKEFPTARYVVTIDYDSLFTYDQMARLLVQMHDNPDVDVLVAMQQKREGGEILAQSHGEVVITDEKVPIKWGHFGLTAFKRDVFDRIKKPWFWEQPDPNGGWEEGRIDADIGFWKNCEESGIRVFLSTDVVIGHLEYVATYPNLNLQPTYVHLNDWRAGRRPADIFNRFALAEAAAQQQLTMKTD